MLRFDRKSSLKLALDLPAFLLHASTSFRLPTSLATGAPVAIMPSAKASTSASAAASGAKLTKLESALYRAAQASRGGIITQDQISEQFKGEELADQLQAINGLLKKSLFTAQTLNGSIQFAATAKAEASMMGKLDENESMVYQHIKDSRNEGIWTKQLKARTGLHQTIINRCLKSLEQKQLVKAVKSVKYPTRKIYMLFGLTPSTELSGGPWYTDNELDTGFINELSMAILNFIRSKSFPKNGQSRALFPTSHTSQLPSASQIHSYLRNSGLTETELELEHVVSLLDILVYDEQVEKIPVMSFSFGGVNGFDEEDGDYSDSGTSSGGSGSDRESANGSDSESEAEESGSDRDGGKGRKRKVKKERKDDDDSEEEDDGPVSGGKRKRSSSKSSSRKKSKSSKSSKRSKSDKRRSKSRSRSRSRSRSKAASSSSSGSESDSDDDSRKRSSKKSSNGTLSIGSLDPFVYRAIRPHSVKVGWTETPCGHCPVFDFCDDAGPVNAASCQYYGGKEDELGRKLTNGWIDTVVDDEDEEDEDAEGEDDGGVGEGEDGGLE